MNRTISRSCDIVITILSLGLNKLLGRLIVNPKYRRIVWILIAANEIRGIIMTWPLWKLYFGMYH